jgi:hypothetical protein
VQVNFENDRQYGKLPLNKGWLRNCHSRCKLELRISYQLGAMIYGGQYGGLTPDLLALVLVAIPASPMIATALLFILELASSSREADLRFP